MTGEQLEIILIEDDPDDAEMIIYTLSKSLAKVSHIGDGVDALAYFFVNKCKLPDLIVLDLRMPKVDGVEVLRKLKSDADLKQIPVLALISSPQGKNYLESFGLAADGYLLKPVNLTQFSKVLHQIGITGTTDPSMQPV